MALNVVHTYYKCVLLASDPYVFISHAFGQQK